MTKKDIVILVTVILLVWYGIYSTLRDVDADEPKDYSWASELMQKREENRAIKETKRTQVEALQKEIGELNKENDLITCKLEKGDKNATCSFQ